MQHVTTLYSTCTHAHTHTTLVFTVISLRPLLGNGFQWHMFCFHWVPNFPRPQLPVSNSSSSQGLNRSSPLSLTHSPTNSSLTPLTSWHGLRRKHHFPLLLYPLIALELLHLCLFPEMLHSNVCCIVASFIDIA
jgi:hypothetical protein